MRYNLRRIKRFLRILLNAATVLSLLLCVATAVVWVRSCAAGESIRHWRWSPGGDGRGTLRAYGIKWCAGGVAIVRRLNVPKERPPAGSAFPEGWSFRRNAGEAAYPVVSVPAEYGFDRTRRGFQVAGWVTPETSSESGQDSMWLTVPCWALVLALSTVPAARAAAGLSRIRSVRQTRGKQLCRTCGYDLRATPNRCPECGTVPKGERGAFTPSFSTPVDATR